MPLIGLGYGGLIRVRSTKSFVYSFPDTVTVATNISGRVWVCVTAGKFKVIFFKDKTPISSKCIQFT